MASKTPKKLNKILGIEISESNIIGVEVQFAKNKILLTNGFKINIAVFQDVNKSISIINQYLKSSNIRTKDCAIGYSMQYFKLHPTPIPLTIPQNEIGSIVIQEGNVNPAEEVASWMPLKNTEREEADGVKKLDILGISLQRPLIDFAKLICQKCNLKLHSVSPSFLALGTFLQPRSDNNLTATLWVSQLRSELVVWSGNEPIYEHLFLSHQLNDQVFQSVNLIQSQIPGTQLSTIFTCGPFVKETNLSQLPFNIQSFTLPLNFADAGRVFQQININEIIPPLGLAWSVSNNTPYTLPNLLNPIKTKSDSLGGIFKDAKTAQKKGGSVPTTTLELSFSKFIFAAAIIILITILSSITISTFIMPGVDTNKGIFNNRINLAQAHLTKLLNFEKTNKILNIKTGFLSALIDKRKPWSRVLREIGDMTPRGLWIDRLEIKNTTIDIFGRALNIDSVANFSINLNYTAKLLGKAQIIALRKFQEEGVELIEFQLSVSLKEQPKKLFNLTNQNLSKTLPKT